MISKKENIEIELNNQKKNISLSIDRKIWIDEKNDFIGIEIKEKDDIIKMINPLEVDDNCYNINYNLKKYNKKSIALPSFGKTKEIELSQGIINYLENKEDIFYHDCITKEGNSGGPIILTNNFKIIGINKGSKKKNIGIYFKEILKNINKEKKEANEKNIIECIIDIKLEEIKNGVILFNQSKDNKNEIKDNINIFLKDKEINIINEEDKWKCDYDFKEEGKYEIKLIFNNNITDLSKFFSECSLLYSIDLSNFNTSKVNNMELMFNECHKLKEIKGINKFNTSQVTNMSGMF